MAVFRFRIVLAAAWLGVIAAWGCDGTSGRDANTTDPADAADLEDTDTNEALFDSVMKDGSLDEAAYLFDPKRITDVRLTLPQDVWEQLIIDARDEEYVPAEVAIDGVPVGEVGLRFKGYYGQLQFCFRDDEMICDKLSMKIRFDKYDADKRFNGLNRINLHSMKDDDSLMKEYLAFRFYRQMGIVTSRTGYANVYVNDELLGLYCLVEQIDERFAGSRFTEGHGNLYKEVQLGDPPDKLNAALRTNEGIGDHSVFLEYSQALMEATDETLTATLAQWMNMEYLMRYMAVDDAILNWDGITAFYCGEEWGGCMHHNFYLYQEETVPRFWLIPWDLNATFDAHNWMPFGPWDDLSVDCESLEAVDSEMMARPACGDPMLRALALYTKESDQYQKALRYLLDNLFVLERLNEEVDAIAQILEPYVQADPERDLHDFQVGVVVLKDDLMISRNIVAKRLN